LSTDPKGRKERMIQTKNYFQAKRSDGHNPVGFKHKRVSPCHQGSVLLYVLLTVALFMLMFSSLIYFLGRNTNYVATAMVQNKLYFDATSTEEKILGLFQTNPSNEVVYNEVNKPTRDMKFDGYRSLVDSYVYKGKSDLITITPNDYNVDTGKQTLPQNLVLTRQAGSFTDLFVLYRFMDPVSNFQQASFSKILTSTDSSFPIPLAYCPPGGSFPDNMNGPCSDPSQTKNALVDHKLQIIVSLPTDTNADKGALYTLTSDGTGLLNEHVHIELTVTSYEYAKSLGTGQALTTSMSTDLKFPSYQRVSQVDFANSSSDQSLISSLSNPGISTAYIDNFQVESDKDWTPAGGTPVFDNSGMTLSNETYKRNQSLKTDFDVRVIETVPSAGQFQTGLFMANTAARDTIYARVAIISPSSITYYKEETDANGNTACVQSSDLPTTDDFRTFAFCQYDTSGNPLPSSEANPCTSTTHIFRDHSDTCRQDATASQYPEFFPLASTDPQYFVPDTTTPNKVAIRLVREGNQVTASYCKTGYNCEVNGAWVDLGPQVQVSFPGNGVYPGLFDQGQDSVFSYFRATSLYKSWDHPATFTSVIDYGKPTPISTIDLDGYAPDSAHFEVKVSYQDQQSGQTVFGKCLTLDGRCTSMVFTPVTSDGNQIVTNKLTLQISFLTMSGNLSDIPFIRSLEGYFDPGTGSCKPQTCDTIQNPTSCTTDQPCANGCGGSLVCSGETPPTTYYMCNTSGQCVSTTSCTGQNCYTSSNCNNACTPPSYQCTGSDPTNATMCTGDNQDLTADTPKTLVEHCGNPKCEFICNSGYHYVAGTGGGGASCQPDMCPVPTYTPAREDLPMGWTNGNVNASVTYGGQNLTHTFTENGAYNWPNTPCNANVDWIDKIAPTCGLWSPGPEPQNIPWAIGFQTFTNNGSDSLSGLVSGSNQCTVISVNGNCNATLQDKAGNTTVCGPSPQAKIIPDATGLTFFADYTDNPNGLNSDIPIGGTIPATNVNASQSVPNGLSVTPGAGNYVSYPASNVLNPSQGTIEIVVDGSDLQSAGYSYLFDATPDGTTGTYPRISLDILAGNYLKFLIQNTSTDTKSVLISLSGLPLSGNVTIKGIYQNSDYVKLKILNSSGIEIASNQSAAVATVSLSSISSFFIGSQVGGAQVCLHQTGGMCDQYGPSQYNGSIKSVKIWNTSNPPAGG